MPRWLRLLASFQFIGGVAALAGAFLPKDSAPGSVNFTVILFPLFAGAVAAVAGVLLVLREPFGIKLSFLVQLAQVLSFTAGWRYLFLAGPRITWLINSSGTGVVFGFGGMGIATTSPSDGALNAIGVNVDAQLGFFGAPLASATWAVGLNLVAAYFALRLWPEVRRLGSQRSYGT